MTIRLRKINSKDAELLQKLAAECGTLDIHTIYTYWVMCNYFKGYILELDNIPVGYITSVENETHLLIWQIGVLKKYRGHGYSQLLIDALVADIENKIIQVTIDKNNKESNGAFRKYASEHDYDFVAVDEVIINGIDTSEKEVRYNIIKNKNCEKVVTEMKEIKGMATMKTRLTDSMIKVVEHIVDHLNSGTIRDDLTSNPGYRYVGIEDLVYDLQSDTLDVWEFCEMVRDRLNADGTPNINGKAAAYDMIYK